MCTFSYIYQRLVASYSEKADLSFLLTSSDQWQYKLWSCQNVCDALSFLYIIISGFVANCWYSDGYKMCPYRGHFVSMLLRMRFQFF